ncbi:MAG: hypothetical protein PHQ18_02495 [Patescibacteria group bacterium]|nr:hypothetical protein [Patescibacteria group bacterium]
MKKFTTKKIIITLISIMVLFPILFPIIYTVQNQFFYPTYSAGDTGIPPHTGKFVCSHFKIWNHGFVMEDYCDYTQFKKEFVDFAKASSVKILGIYSWPITFLPSLISSKIISEIFFYSLFTIPFYISILSAIIFFINRKKTDKTKLAKKSLNISTTSFFIYLTLSIGMFFMTLSLI